MSCLLAVGLVDLYAARAGGAPEPDGRTVPARYGGAEFTGVRLDYLLGITPVVALTREVWVGRRGTRTMPPTDYPVLAELGPDTRLSRPAGASRRGEA
ncbi:hypothetical protein ABZ807_10865 [Micromonospora sp. NPDC047548]|uniref:hypothetical protein n=1 Tax=Micromonospora sp. NPDC047548 TaxID=3155624 RepID=UPI0033DE13E1